MNTLKLQTEVTFFELLFQAFELVLAEAEPQTAYTLCELYATMIAFRIRACITVPIEADTQSAAAGEIIAIPKDMGSAFRGRRTLPKAETVRASAKELFA